MSILRTHNLQNPDSSTINIVMDQGGNTNIAGVTTVGGSNFHVPSGSVGIGTDAPGAKLEVRDGSSQGIIIRSNSTQATDTNKALRVRNNSDTNTFHVSHKGQGYFAGSVGIGTDNPDRHLHLRRVDNGVIGIKLQNNEGTASILADSDALELYSDTTVLRSESGTERVRLNSTGFGIGVSPQQKLDVVGSAHTVAVFRPDTNTVSAYGDASAVNNLINLRMPYGSNPGSSPNNGARWGIKFQGRNDGAEYGTDAGKSASIYAVSEDTTAGYNRKVGLSFYTSPLDANQEERLRIQSDGSIYVGGSIITESDMNWAHDSNQRPHIFTGQSGANPADGVIVAASAETNPSATRIGSFVYGCKTSSNTGAPNSGIKAYIDCHTNTNVSDAWKTGAYINFATRANDGSLNLAQRISSDGEISKPKQPGFYARRTTAGDGRAAGGITEWHISGTGSYNEGGHFKTSGVDQGKFVAPVTGKYYFSAQPGYKQTNSNFQFYFRINGTNVNEPVRVIDGGDDLTSHCAFTGSCIVYMGSGDKFDVYVGNTHHVNTTYNFFCGYLIG